MDESRVALIWETVHTISYRSMTNERDTIKEVPSVSAKQQQHCSIQQEWKQLNAKENVGFVVV
jgi:hypothetical protein